MTKIATLGIVTNSHGEILFGEKDGQAKLGANCRNGPGGDLENNETLEQCMAREIREESTLEVLEMKQLGVVIAHVLDVPKLEVHIFHISKFAGAPQETDAMKNWRWYPPTLFALPFDEMHDGDKHWFPELLKHMESGSEKKFTIRLFYERPGEGFIKMDIL